MASCILLPERSAEGAEFLAEEIVLPTLVQGIDAYAHNPRANATAKLLLLAREFQALVAELEDGNKAA